MTFRNIYSSNSFPFSVEVFPPKTAQGVLKLFEEINRLKPLKPAFISVTYGAMGSTRDLTQDLAIQIFETLKVTTAFHFTCLGTEKNDVDVYVDHLRQRGINLVVALRGDRDPKNPSVSILPDGFRHANELVAHLKDRGKFSIAVAGYPEKHPEAMSLDADIQNLKRKVDAGAEIIITQLFFENELFYRWVEKVRQAGIDVPIVAGIMPVQKLNQVKRITEICGTTLPPALVRKLAACGDDEAAMQQVGIDYATEQCCELVSSKIAAGIHFYSLNKAAPVIKVWQACRGLVGAIHESPSILGNS